ncbi:MAG: hypothetical protein K0R50_2545, partial [Eubacterium sp.]|nr:hypothetical protein [Eubacterium sp.]
MKKNLCSNTSDITAFRMQCERLRKLGFTLFFKWEMSDG